MRRWQSTLGSALLAAVLLITSVACSRGGETLEGTQWKLVGWTLSSLSPTDFTITAEFSGGQISGSSGVNRFGGPYRAGPGKTFSVGQLAGTLMAGPEPAMRAESAYLKLLGEARVLHDGRRQADAL